GPETQLRECATSPGMRAQFWCPAALHPRRRCGHIDRMAHFVSKEGQNSAISIIVVSTCEELGFVQNFSPSAIDDEHQIRRGRISEQGKSRTIGTAHRNQGGI